MKVKKIIIPIIIVLVVIAALVGSFALLWFKTDLFNWLKKSDNLFADQIKTAFDLKDAKFTDYSETLKEYKELSDKPMKSKLNISANLNISELDQKTQDIINKSKITIENNADTKNQKAQSKIGLYSDNSEILTLDMITNNGKIGIGCKELSDKYFAVSTEDMIDYMKKESNLSDDELESITKAISGESFNSYDLLYISEDDLKHLDQTYSVDKILGLVSKDCFSKESKVEVEVDGDEVKAYATYLTLTGADTYKFIEDFTKLVKDDSVITNLITEKANLFLEYAGEDKISEKEMQNYINEIFDEMLNGMESIKDEKDSAVQIAIYSKNNKPVRIDINALEDVEDSDKETLISIEYAKNKNIYTIYNNEKAYMTIVDEYEKKEDEEYKGKLTAKANGMSLGTLKYEIIDKEKESKLNLELNVPLANINAKIDISSNGDYKKEAVNVNGSMSIQYASESAEIKFDGTVDYTGNVSVPELNSSNSIDVLKLSNEDAQKELENIAKKASEILPERLKKLGIDIDNADLFKTTTNTDVVTKVPETTDAPETTNTPEATDVPQIPDINDIQKQTEETQKMIEQNQELLNSIPTIY